MLFCLTLFLLAGQAGGEYGTFSEEGVRVDVRIRSGNYLYTVTNNTEHELTGFSVQQHAAHLFSAPEGWEYEVEGGVAHGDSLWSGYII